MLPALDHRLKSEGLLLAFSPEAWIPATSGLIREHAEGRRRITPACSSRDGTVPAGHRHARAGFLPRAAELVKILEKPSAA